MLLNYILALAILGLFQPLLFKQFPNFVNYNSNRNTYEYIMFFRGTLSMMLWKQIGHVKRVINQVGIFIKTIHNEYSYKRKMIMLKRKKRMEN